LNDHNAAFPEFFGEFRKVGTLANQTEMVQVSDAAPLACPGLDEID
jgi:hypothetical protein